MTFVRVLKELTIRGAGGRGRGPTATPRGYRRHETSPPRNAFARDARIRYSRTERHTVEPLEPDDDLLESLYVVNKVAKRLADEATAAYDRGDVTDSNVSSARKDALYRTKTEVLNRIVAADPAAVTGEYHAVHGDVWLLVTVDGWEFHQPPYAFGNDLTDRIETSNSIDEPRDVSYVRDASVERSDRSLEEALLGLAAHGVDANDHLARPTISGERDQLVDVRWPCLR